MGNFEELYLFKVDIKYMVMKLR